MKSKTLAAIVLAAGIGAAGFAGGYYTREFSVGKKELMPVQPSAAVELYNIDRVIDGDTIDVKEGVEVLLRRIRILGIDTPERNEPFYEEAATALKNIIGNYRVRLERDTNSKNVDAFGRPLRHVFAGDTNVAVEMARLGYTNLDRYKGLKYEPQLSEALKEAQENKRGIWTDRK